MAKKNRGTVTILSGEHAGKLGDVFDKMPSGVYVVKLKDAPEDADLKGKGLCVNVYKTDLQFNT